jgi:hypothetical protein
MTLETKMKGGVYMNWHRGAILLSIVLVAVSGSSFAPAQDMPADYRQVLTYIARKGDYAENVLKVGIPRNDISVAIAGIKTPTSFGFAGWLGFTKGNAGNDVMMGDLVLLQEEVNPVLSALLEQGLDVTALHNHFFWDEPRVCYMHVHGHGHAIDLARKIRPALDLIGHVRHTGETGHAEPPDRQPVPGAILAVEGKLKTENLDRIIGNKGELNGPVYKFTIGRNDLKLEEMGATINSRMGLNTWAAFIGTDDNAAVAGDVAMLETEVTPVLKALRKNGLDVVAIHHHMTGTDPMIIFLHYWGEGPAVKLASGFRAALEELGKKEENKSDTGSHEHMQERSK